MLTCDSLVRRNRIRRKFGYHLLGMTPRVNIRGKRLSSIAIMSTRGIEDVAIYEGNIMVKLSVISSRCVVVMDNALIHHVERVATSIQGTGAILWYFPPYSPDFNLLEEAFAKVNLKSNEIAYQATNSTHLLVLMAYNTVSTEDSIGYITHAGYNIMA